MRTDDILRGDRPYLTDGGLETTLVFHDGVDLPDFAAFVLMGDAHGRARLRDYYRLYAGIAAERGYGFVFEAPTWRASPRWGDRLGWTRSALAAANRDSITLMKDVAAAFRDLPAVFSGQIGPQGDGYAPEAQLSPDEAEIYHAFQTAAFKAAGADLATALTMTHAGEAIGVVRAAQAVDLPVVISFTVETDGRLPSGQSLADAIGEVDAETGSGPIHYKVNCAHPSHFEDRLAESGGWRVRIGGIRANASRLSHAELDEAVELDDGDPIAFGRENAALKALLPNLRVVGGCCGTDHRHVEEVGRSLAA